MKATLGHTEEALVGMTSEQFLFSLVDEIQRREQEGGFPALSAKEQIFVLVWELEAEVNNGGFNQFFFNSAGDRAIETINALQKIGAEHTATLLEQAIRVFGVAGISGTWSIRQDQVESLTEAENEKLTKLDQEFYAYTDNLSDLLAHFMRNN